MAATLHLDSTARRRFGSHVLKEPKSPKTDAMPLVQHEAWLQNGRQRGRIASFLKPYGLLQFLVLAVEIIARALMLYWRVPHKRQPINLNRLVRGILTVECIGLEITSRDEMLTLVGRHTPSFCTRTFWRQYWGHWLTTPYSRTPAYALTVPDWDHALRRELRKYIYTYGTMCCDRYGANWSAGT